MSYFCDGFKKMTKPSKRILDIVNLLPLEEGLRVLEIGCGTGVAAREICARFKNIYVLAIDRSDKAIAQSIASSATEIESGKLAFEKSSIEELELKQAPLFDFAFAIRVGALDGRHLELEKRAKEKIKAVLKENGKLFIDISDNSVVEIPL